MGNVLSGEKREQVLALGRLGWPLRRIEEATGVRRETAGDYTTLLHANGEDVKVVQELLRHSSSRITMDIYAQAQMPAKRAAQQKVVAMVRLEKTAAGG